MDRRKFLGSALASGGLAASAASLRAAQQAAGAAPRGYYELRLYHIISGPQRQLADSYFRDALIPALNQLDIKPVGVLNTTIGSEGPSCYVLMPAARAEILITAEARLADDAEYQKAAFWPIFMGDTIIGGRQPNLTYMIGFSTLADRDKNWAVFIGSPEWKALAGSQRYAFEPLVSNIDNEILSPAAYSQI